MRLSQLTFGIFLDGLLSQHFRHWGHCSGRVPKRGLSEPYHRKTRTCHVPRVPGDFQLPSSPTVLHKVATLCSIISEGSHKGKRSTVTSNK